jgi:ABC-type amino acid transport substrate-binding protein
VQPVTSKGYTFSTPYLINGLSIAGHPSFLQCFSNSTVDDLCQGVKICVLDGTTHLAKIQSFLPDDFEGSIVTPTTVKQFYTYFKEDNCNVLAGEQFDLAETVVYNNGYNGLYVNFTDVLDKELISMVTRDGDPKFSDFVNHVLQSLITAEERGKSGDIVATDLARTDLFGSRYLEMFQDVFQVVGDYETIYNRSLDNLLPRSLANQINIGNTPGSYPKPFGDVQTSTPDLKSSTIEAIRDRGFILVGIAKAPLFADIDSKGEYQGIDVDYAKALSAALFDGVWNKIEFVVVSADERFEKLRDGVVDVLARVTTNTMERDVKEPTTGKGYTMSTPNFYDSIRFVGVAE